MGFVFSFSPCIGSVVKRDACKIVGDDSIIFSRWLELNQPSTGSYTKPLKTPVFYLVSIAAISSFVAPEASICASAHATRPR